MQKHVCPLFADEEKLPLLHFEEVIDGLNVRLAIFGHAFTGLLRVHPVGVSLCASQEQI